MALKQWNSEPWECPQCGYNVKAKELHGDSDCIAHLKFKAKLYRASYTKLCLQLASKEGSKDNA